MGECINNCKPCTSRELYDLKIINLSFPNEARPGDVITISYAIENDSYTMGDVYVCVYDRVNGNCLYGNLVTLWGHEISAVQYLTLTMPAKNLNLKISVTTTRYFELFLYCEDFKDFTIKVIYPPGTQTYNCSGSACIPAGTLGNYSSSNCDNECNKPPGNGGDKECKAGQRLILGQCVTNSDLYTFLAIIAVFTYLQKR